MSVATYSEQTAKFYKEMQALFRKHGYNYKHTKTSAQEFLTWTKGEHLVEIAGWHGDGNYSKARNVLDAYNGREQIAELVDIFGDINRHCILNEEAQQDYPRKLHSLKLQLCEVIRNNEAK